MISYLVLGIALLAGVMLAGQWYARADPKSIVRALKWLLVVLIVAIVLFFVLSGRLFWALAAIPALLPWFFRIRQAARTAKTFHRMGQAAHGGPGSAPGQTSDVTTRFLDMTLDHGSGEISGTVREGPLAGRPLGDLTVAELQSLYMLCRQDTDSLKILESYLDRYHPEWRDNREDASSGNTTSGPLSRSDALAILGLDENASDDDIRDAHRRLIANLHPDKGGSSYLAAQINQAKDVLLG